jgi:hypothetical protein
MTIPVQTRAHSPRRDSTYLSGITVQTNRATSLNRRCVLHLNAASQICK